jgi:hypothetical protein
LPVVVPQRSVGVVDVADDHSRLNVSGSPDTYI